MIRKDAQHGLIFKQLVGKVIVPNVKKQILVRRRSLPGKWFTALAIEQFLAEMEANLTKNMPAYDFRLVELAPNRFNFIGEEKKAA